MKRRIFAFLLSMVLLCSAAFPGFTAYAEDTDTVPETTVETEAPATEDPETEPPVTEAPATEPPVTEAPATEPPVTEAPATEPPVTEAPVEDPCLCSPTPNPDGSVSHKPGCPLYEEVTVDEKVCTCGTGDGIHAADCPLYEAPVPEYEQRVLSSQGFKAVGKLPETAELSVTELRDELNAFIHYNVLGLDDLAEGWTAKAYDIKIVDKETRAEIAPTSPVSITMYGTGTTPESQVTVYHLKHTDWQQLDGALEVAKQNPVAAFFSDMFSDEEEAPETPENTFNPASIVTETPTVQTGKDYVFFLTDSFSVFYVMSYTPTTTEAEEPADEVEPPVEDIDPADDPVLTTHVITINYVMSDSGEVVHNPYLATIKEGEPFSATVPSPSVVGYAPDPEIVELNYESVTQDDIITVKYYPAEVPFTVEYYLQNVEDNEYTLAGSTVVNGHVTGSTVGAGLAPARDGFLALVYDPDTKVAADGSTVVKIYYDRQYYLMSFDLAGGYGVDPIYARYGAPISVGEPSKSGYSFAGWDNTVPATMPATNSSYTAQWDPTEMVPFTVAFWYENANDTNYSFVGSATKTALVDSTVNGYDYRNENFSKRDNQHFTYSRADSNVTVRSDGSTVVNVYFTRNTYTVKFEFNRERVTMRIGEVNYTSRNGTDYSFTAKYESDISALWPTADNFTNTNGSNFIGWMLNNTYNVSKRLVLTDDLITNNTLNAGWNKNVSLYTLNYYMQNVDGTDYELSSAYSQKLYYQSGAGSWSQKDIDGFSKNANSVSIKNGVANMYYTRNKYTLSFNNKGTIEKSEQVYFEAPLNGKDFVPPYPTGANGLEPGAYEFEGWYTTSDCLDGTKFDFATGTMPSHALELYAHWAPITHTVNTFLDETAMNDGQTPLNTYKVPHAHVVDPKPANPENGAYEFVGWFYKENGAEKAFDFSTQVRKDLNVYAKWRSNKIATFTIHYQQEDGTPVAEDFIGSGLAGTTKTVNAKAGNELNEAYRSGYFPTVKSHNVDVLIDDTAVYTFIYVAKAKVPYIVKYVNAETGEELAPAKHAETPNAVITEEFARVPGYMPDAYQKRLVLVASDNESDNELIFYYTYDPDHAYVKESHYVEQLNGEYVEYPPILPDYVGNVGTTYTIEERTIPGYELTTKENMNVPSGELTTNGLHLKLYYDLIEYPYEVRYLEENTNRELHESKKDTAKYTSQVTENYIELDNYELVSSTQQSIIIQMEEGTEAAKNIITFYYKEKTVTINYVAVTENNEVAGTVNPASEVVKIETGVPNGSFALPVNNEWLFEGWYQDEQCTEKVPENWITVDSDNENKVTIVPQKPEGKDVFEAATYYAKFKPALADLTITKTGDYIEPGQSFVFTVSGMGVNLEVVIHGAGSVTIKDLPVGSYTVSEVVTWSWRYGPELPVQNVTVDADESNSVTFVNGYGNDYWLNGCDYETNVFN